jgi:hypothetical protein
MIAVIVAMIGMIIPNVYSEESIEEVPFIFEVRENDWTTGGIGTGNSVFIIITGEIQDKGYTKLTINGLFRNSFPMTMEETIYLTQGKTENFIPLDYGLRTGEEYTLTATNGEYSTSVTWIPIPLMDKEASTTIKDDVSVEALEKIHTRAIHVKDVFPASMKDRWYVVLEICSGERALSKPTLTIESDIETVPYFLNKNINVLSCAQIDPQVKAKDPSTIYFEFEVAEIKNYEEIDQLKKEIELLKEMMVEEQSVPVVETIVEEKVVEEIIEESIIATQESPEGGGCLIATAAYGSELSPQVQLLREIRDNQLMNTEAGSAFMGTFNNVYYSFSPVIADMQRESPMFKEAVKLGLTPMLSSLTIMENAESESEVISLGLSVIALNLGMYLGIPAVMIVGIRKRF